MGEFDWRYWSSLTAIALWVAIRDAERGPIIKRMIKIVSSGLLAYGAGPELAPYLNSSEITAAIVIMVLGHVALDLVTALFNDKDFIKDIIKRKLGGGSNKNE